MPDGHAQEVFNGTGEEAVASGGKVFGNKARLKQQSVIKESSGGGRVENDRDVQSVFSAARRRGRSTPVSRRILIQTLNQ